ncbi:hypothetical protein [Streptomyces sp. NPDC086519]|uniref:hypothetical protein n=1 Tax=Streptomyces sp. NPDC086519 TaxID=3154863 RepID=UPI0034473748
MAGTPAAEETAAPVESLDEVARMLKDHLGANSVSFLITDFTGDSVVRLGAAGSVDTDEPARRITLRGTLYDDVIRTQRPSVEDKGEGALVRVVAPVTNCGDAIGLLELFLRGAPDAEVMREIGETAHALAYIVIANRSYTDVYQRGRRTVPLSLAAGACKRSVQDPRVIAGPGPARHRVNSSPADPPADWACPSRVERPAMGKIRASVRKFGRGHTRLNRSGAAQQWLRGP